VKGSSSECKLLIFDALKAEGRSRLFWAKQHFFSFHMLDRSTFFHGTGYVKLQKDALECSLFEQLRPGSDFFYDAVKLCIVSFLFVHLSSPEFTADQVCRTSTIHAELAFSNQQKCSGVQRNWILFYVQATSIFRPASLKFRRTSIPILSHFITFCPTRRRRLATRILCRTPRGRIASGCASAPLQSDFRQLTFELQTSNPSIRSFFPLFLKDQQQGYPNASHQKLRLKASLQIEL
jgi:hypothetical protein